MSDPAWLYDTTTRLMHAYDGMRSACGHARLTEETKSFAGMKCVVCLRSDMAKQIEARERDTLSKMLETRGRYA